MREIKFRAWDDFNKIWLDPKIFSIGIDDGLLRNKECSGSIGGVQINQYTGLKDKTGKEIYEGDIVLYPDTESEYVDVGVGNIKVAETEVNSFGEVKFQEGTFGIICPTGSETLRKGFKSFWWITNEYGFKLNELEVIGNIYENPEPTTD